MLALYRKMQKLMNSKLIKQDFWGKENSEPEQDGM